MIETCFSKVYSSESQVAPSVLKGPLANKGDQISEGKLDKILEDIKLTREGNVDVKTLVKVLFKISKSIKF